MRSPVRLAALLVLALAAGAAPASAANCASGTTSWTNPNGGSWKDAANWSNGLPTDNCDAAITLAGDYVVSFGQTSGTGYVQARSVILGGSSGTQTLFNDNSVCAAETFCSQGDELFAHEDITVNSHGVLKLSAGEVDTFGRILLNGGQMVGNGIVRGQSGLFNNGGLVMPTPAADPGGVLDIDSAYLQDSAATLAVTIPAQGSSGHSAVLSVTGKVSLDGTLRVNGPSPMRRQATRLIRNRTGITGSFSTVSFSDQPYELRYDAVGLLAGPPNATCVSGSTSWTKSSSGSWFDPANWSNGVPSSDCDALITAAGTYTVSVGEDPGEGAARSITLGGASGTQTLRQFLVTADCGFSVECADDLLVGAGGITVNANGELKLEDGGHLSTPGAIRVEGGRVTGNGSLYPDGGLINAGTVAPDDLTVVGPYTQEPAGTLVISQPGRGDDSVRPSSFYITGATHLDGTLRLRTATPPLTDLHVILEGGYPVTGRFSSVVYDGPEYEVSYEGPGVVVRPPHSTCTSGTTSWTNPHGGSWDIGGNWSNGRPSANCDARITLPGDYVVSLGTGAGIGGAARSLVLGAPSETQTLDYGERDCSRCQFDLRLLIGAGGVTVGPHGVF